MTKSEIWVSALLIFVIGLVHLFAASIEMNNTLANLFILHSLASAVVALMLIRNVRLSWELALFLSLGAIVGYILSRTVGLPGMDVEEWGSPTGTLSLILEAVFFGFYIRKRFSSSLIQLVRKDFRNPDPSGSGETP